MERLRRSLARFIQAEPQELWPLAWSFVYFFCLLCGTIFFVPCAMKWLFRAESQSALDDDWHVCDPAGGDAFVRMVVCSLFRYRLLLAVYGFFIANLIALYF